MKLVSRAVLVVCALVPLLTPALSCNKMRMPGAGKLGQDCPDLASVEAVGKIDWQAKYNVSAEAAMKFDASLKAAASMRELSKDLESELRDSCNGLAADLGASGGHSTAEAACEAARKAMVDVRGQLSASARIFVNHTPARCSASMDAMAECTASCQADVAPGEVKVECDGGEISGTCGAQCSGRCEVEAGAKCVGTCEGACTANFKGKCNGTCEGKCNGKNVNGRCAGTCTGACDLVAEGACKGECKGSCKIKGKAQCEGTCTGQCSVAFEAPQCTGSAKPPQATASCESGCQAQVEAKVACTPPKVSVVVEGSADAKLASNYKHGLEKHMPNIFKIATGMKNRVANVVASGEAAIKAGKDAAISASSAGVQGAKVAACVGKPFENALSAAASMQASVQISVNVSASASASAGGAASASTAAVATPAG